MYPRLVHIYGPLWIQSYGVMIALGFLVFLFLTLNHPLRKKNINKETYLNTLFIALMSGVIGGRALFVITNLEEFSGRWVEIFYPWIGGLTVLGAIISVLVSSSLFLRWHKVPILPMLDLAAIYAPLMHAIARLGCLCAGCCYGAPASGLLWAITFTNPESHAPLNMPLHPSQIYMSLASLSIFVLLYAFANRLQKKPGLLICSFLILENLSRFTLDFWRGDRHPIFASFYDGAITLSQVQLLSIIGLLLSVCAFMWIWCMKKIQPHSN